VSDHPGKRSPTGDPAFDASRRAAFRSDEELGEQAAPFGRLPPHDLFPPSTIFAVRPPGAIGGERPPGPLLGTAIGPRLSGARGPDDRPVSLDATPTDEAFYGIAEKPFGLSSDPRFFYPGAAHERILQQLSAAIRDRRGLALLTGEPGVGKTIVCRVVAAALDRRTVTSLLLGRFRTFHDLLSTVLMDFGATSRADLTGDAGVTTEELIATLRLFLASLVPLNANAVIVVDEAQELPADVLRGLIAVVEAGRATGLLQLILVGQPAMGAILKRQELRPLADRISVRSVLGPLAADEIVHYVAHRLTVSGSSGRVNFSAASFAQLYALSRGVPRVVNLLCDRALSRGRETSANVIDAGLIEAAAEDLGLAYPVVERRAPLGRMVIAVALAVLMLGGAAAALWVFRDAVTRTIQQWQRAAPPPSGAA
jgi:general secretion pathway protein A